MKAIFAFAIASLLVAVTAHTAFCESTDAKIPLPDMKASAEASILAGEVYKDAFAKARKPDDKAALAKKILQAGMNETKDQAGRYALLILARDTATDVGDVDVSLDAVVALDQSFLLDSLTMKATVFRKLLKTAGTTAKLLMTRSVPCIDHSIHADRYELASEFSDISLAAARRWSDAKAVDEMMLRTKEVSEIRQAHKDASDVFQLLDKSPTDPMANLQAGRFYCFSKGDWQRGLPMLALGGDPLLKSVAEAELSDVKDAGAQAKIGDRWWDLASTESGTSKRQMQLHSYMWYERAAPQAMGLSRMKIEKRLADLDALGIHRTVNLLKLVDIKRDSVNGTWNSLNEGLISDAGAFSRIEIRYRPPPEYDYRIVFTRKSGNELAAQLCWAAEHQFSWVIGGAENTLCGFEWISDKGIKENATGRRSASWLQNGRRYTSVVKIRRDGVRAYLDGKLVSEFKTDYTSMTQGRHLHRADSLGLQTHVSSVIFHSVEVVEISEFSD